MQSRDCVEDEVFFMATASSKRLVIWEAREVNAQADPERIATPTTWEDLRYFSTKVSLVPYNIMGSSDHNGNEGYTAAISWGDLCSCSGDGF